MKRESSKPQNYMLKDSKAERPTIVTSTLAAKKTQTLFPPTQIHTGWWIISISSFLIIFVSVPWVKKVVDKNCWTQKRAKGPVCKSVKIKK